jgi:predicted alpha/beta hydrolase family esterase
MLKRVFIIHGWEGTPDSNWFPWLKRELGEYGFEVAVPQMPNANFPKMEEWMAYLRKIVGKPDENTFFVGHSLGTIAILRYFESLSEREKVGGAILVAAFSESIGIEVLENFFATPLDYEKIKKVTGKIVVINSDNDPYVPLAQGEALRDELGAKLIIVPNGQHLNAGNGYFEFPLVLEEILEIA